MARNYAINSPLIKHPKKASEKPILPKKKTKKTNKKKK